MIGPVYNLLTDAVDRISAYRKLSRNKDALLRLLYLECRRNDELFSAVNIDKDCQENDPTLRSLINNLQMDMLEAVFLVGDENSGLFDILGQKVESVSSEKPVNVLQQCGLLFIKIEALKKIVTFEKGTALKKIQYTTRLTNIKNHLTNILKVLGKQPAIQKILIAQEKDD